MFEQYKKMKKAIEAEAFAVSVQKELLEQKNEEWKSKIKQYVRANADAPYVGSTVVHVWMQISEMLRDACFYEEALLMGRLAAQHSQELPDDFADVRVKALGIYGLAQIEAMMPERAVYTLRKTLDFVKPGIRSYEFLYFHCSLNLTYACLKAGKYKEGEQVLDSLKKWMIEEKPSGLGNEDLLFVDLSIGNILLYQRRYQEGLLLAQKMEEQIQAFHLENAPIYYKTLAMRALFEKMNNHIALYYNLTKKAISYAKKAGDLAEERAYLANLLDAMNRLGKSEEMFYEMHDIIKTLEEMTENVNSLNMLQSCMNVLIVLCQYPDMEVYLQQLADKAENAWNALKAQGIDSSSRDALKIQSQFALVNLSRRNDREAEIQLRDCLVQSRKLFGEGDVDTLSVMELLAGMKQQEMKYEEALHIYLEIEKLRKNNGQEKTHSYFETLRSIAYMYYFTGKKQEAFDRIFQYFEESDKYSGETFMFFDELSWKTFSYKFTETLRDILGWMVDSPEINIIVEQVYGIVLRFKNRIYDEEMRWKVRENSPQLAPKIAEYHRLLKMSMPSEDVKGQMDLLEKKYRLQEEISSFRPDSMEICTNPKELEGILGDGEVLFDYVIYNGSGADGEEGYLVFYITREGIYFRDLGKCRYLDEDMENFYRAVSLYRCSKDYLEQQLICVKGGLGLLDNDFGADNVGKIYLGLDGEYMPKMPWHYILSEYETQVLPSFAVLGKKKNGVPPVLDSRQEIFFFANSRIPLGEEVDREQREKMVLSLAIADVSKISLKEITAGKLQVYEKEQANRENFISIHSPSHLHVAVHGYSGVGDSLPGGGITFGKQFQSSVMLMSSQKSYDCLPQNLAEYDGAVTMLDVMQMDLTGTELVVLNSCDTGIGNFRKDEGVYGFPRAFFIAGAEGVLTCLWKVDAIFSVLFLDHFYRSYFAGEDMEQALSQSRDAVKKMTAGDVHDWLERNRESIEEMEKGKEIYAKMKRLTDYYDISSDEPIFCSPAYWACFTLARNRC